ncbi:MAG: ribulose-phosphate 3-epimerase [Firmicutes bacterium]|nr:ribulose-phosphate 3-epimerase [Bacillota bacterium]
MAKIAPSILAADFARLGEDVKNICDIGVDYLHIDIMDGSFVPNISFGSAVMKSLNEYINAPYDVHLMIDNPDNLLEDFVTENTEFITVHQEACRHLNRTVQHIHSLGVKAGVSINPATPVSALENILEYVDLVLVMSVNPGFGGQKFIPSALEKIAQLKEIREKKGYNYLIEVDGGAGVGNAEAIREAGCDIIVSGTAVFKAEDRVEAIAKIKG